MCVVERDAEVSPRTSTFLSRTFDLMDLIKPLLRPFFCIDATKIMEMDNLIYPLDAIKTSLFWRCGIARILLGPMTLCLWLMAIRIAQHTISRRDTLFPWHCPVPLIASYSM
jgi:hypothetical protein